MSATIPRVKVKANRSHSSVDSEVHNISHSNMTAWRRAMRSANLTDKVRKNPKQFWSFFYEKTKSKTIPDILPDCFSEYSNPAAKANLFNKYFQSVLNNYSSPTHLSVENTRPASINV